MSSILPVQNDQANANPDLDVQAAAIGREHGVSAASWVEIDSTNAARILAGIEDGDPAILDSLNEPNLSGEFAGDYVSADLARDLSVAYDSLDADQLMLFSECEESYLLAACEAFWDAVAAACRTQLEPQHTNYPHEAGRLYDCPACEASCHCTPGNAECVYDGDHNGAADEIKPELCANCGTSKVALPYTVIDWREDHICASCFDSHEWDLDLWSVSDMTYTRKDVLEAAASNLPSKPKCATVGCTATATEHISYTYRNDGDGVTEDVCTACADSYSNRVVLTNFTRTPVTHK